MKKHLIVSGIIFVLLIVGFSGCTEFGVGLKNIGDIKAKPDDYIGKEVTIKGNYIYGTVKDDAGHSIPYGYHQNLVGEYRLTGIIRISEISSNVYIEINNVKAL